MEPSEVRPTRSPATLAPLTDLLQLVVPEQLPPAVLEPDSHSAGPSKQRASKRDAFAGGYVMTLPGAGVRAWAEFRELLPLGSPRNPGPMPSGLPEREEAGVP
jgi:hypothetical protein